MSSSHESSCYSEVDGSHIHKQEAVGGISEAQECTEASRWSRACCVCNDPHCSNCRRALKQRCSDESENDQSDFVRVKLSKSSHLDYPYQSSQYFVRAAGGMSIPVPDVPKKSKMSVENNQHPVTPHSVPSVSHLQDGSLAVTGFPGEASSGNHGNKSSSYLPLSVELVAGRGTTSIAADGSKNSSGSSKVKSVPPSRTLAMSAALLKSYLVSSNDKPQSKSATLTVDTETSMKTKMMGIWNNVKFGWTVNLKTNFSRDSPVYLLASVYHKSFGESDDDASEGIEENGMEAFKRHFYSLIWCTYRRQFPTLQDSTFTTDCGWGCMLRSGQMMVAHALILHFLSARWRHIKHKHEGPEETIHSKIIQWFGDCPLPQCPLSLHNLVHLGNRLGKKAGDWYGPASVAYIFKEAIEMGSKYIPDLKRICVYVAQDCAVYIQDVLDLTTSNCICNNGSLIKLSEESRVKEKSTSEYLEQINTSALTPHFPEASGLLENGSCGVTDDRVCVLGVTNKNYTDSSKDLSKRTVSQNSSVNLSDKTRRNDVDSNLLFVNMVQKNPENPKTASESVDNTRGVAKGGETFVQCPKCDNWKSVIIMVPVRLGGESLNPIYGSSVCSLFTHDLCIGIIGGRPKHSLYFVGFQEENLIHLDPHLCQDAVMVTQPNFPLSSYHCSSPRKMSLARMDPSATLGFYCHTRTDFLRLMEELPELLTPKEPGFEYPIFEFVDGRSQDADARARQLTDEDEMAATFSRDPQYLPQDSEEFVFI